MHQLHWTTKQSLSEITQENQSIIIPVSSELYMPVLIKGSKIPQITCFLMLCLCFI